jgi:HEPN domain-containing protein
MARSREDLIEWCLKKAEEYLQSAQENIRAKRLFPAAEEIFRSVESTLEALLYGFGVRKIEFQADVRSLLGVLLCSFLFETTLLGLEGWKGQCMTSI